MNIDTSGHFSVSPARMLKIIANANPDEGEFAQKLMMYDIITPQKQKSAKIRISGPIFINFDSQFKWKKL